MDNNLYINFDLLDLLTLKNVQRELQEEDKKVRENDKND
jgi:hypothetical protein